MKLSERYRSQKIKKMIDEYNLKEYLIESNHQLGGTGPLYPG